MIANQNISTNQYRMLTFPIHGEQLRVFINTEGKVYLCLRDLSVAVSYTAAIKCKEQLPVVKVFAKECINPFQGSVINTVLWDDFKKIGNKVQTPGKNYVTVDLAPFIDRFTEFLKKHNREITASQREQTAAAKSEASTESGSELTDILSRADSFVNEVHTLLEENRQLKERVATLEHRLSEYEAVKDMLLSL